MVIRLVKKLPVILLTATEEKKTINPVRPEVIRKGNNI